VNSLGFGTSPFGIDPVAAAIEERRALRVRAIRIALGVLGVIAVFAGAFLLGRAHGAAPTARAGAPTVPAPGAQGSAPALGLRAAPPIALPAPPPLAHTAPAAVRTSSPASGVFSSTSSGSTATPSTSTSEQTGEPAVSPPASEAPAQAAPAPSPVPAPKHSSSSGGGSSFENSG